jgi:hypothetical protein
VGQSGYVAVPARYNPAPDQGTGDLSGGLGGPAAIPAKYNFYPPPNPPGGGGPGGARFPNFGVYGPVWNAYRPGVVGYLGDQFASVPGGGLHYARPYYPNDAGRETDSAVTVYRQGLSTINGAGPPAVPVPSGEKRYDSATYRRGFGAWAQDFLRLPRMRPQPAAVAQLARYGAQVQQEGPYYPLLTKLAEATSYGATTQVLPSTLGLTESVYG